jgi:(4-(4-[2-(gamma-L-glutamylamino)ethyl]phenoxymethyl)furan-2-yl)methanamine synthase
MANLQSASRNLQSTLGWDIGGANLKLARRDATGLMVVARPFYIWQRRDELAAALRDLAAQVAPAARVGVTITAELSDAFRTKREGIAFVLDALRELYDAQALRVWGVDGRFHDAATAYAQPMLVAAANWLATATLVARTIPAGLLVDVGSTTTDLVPLRDGRVAAQGRNDPQRLLCGELLYTGALRTTVCAIVRHVPLWGGWCPVSAEHFATAQDAHLVAGHLPLAACSAPSADGRSATPAFARERLARVVCADSELLSPDEIDGIARYIARAQVQQIADAISQLLSRGARGPLVAAGVGSFLVVAAAQQLGLDCVPLADTLGQAGSDAAPAAAIATLLAEQPDV